MSVAESHNIRLQFFHFLFGEQKGYVCIASEPFVKDIFEQKFFQWPLEEKQMHGYIDKYKLNRNIWFGINLLSKPERKKEYCLETNLLWADLDDCEPNAIEPPPQVVIQSSPERYQGIWRLDESIDPYTAEDYSRRIYSAYRDNGVDSGWALTKLLRVPYTLNLKYDNKPEVELLQAHESLIPVKIFDALAEVQSVDESDVEIPDLSKLPSVEQILYKYQGRLRQGGFYNVYDYEPTPEDNWSKILWRLLLLSLECGLSNEEVYAIATSSKVNKYARDNRPARHLWRDVLKAYNSRLKFAHTAIFSMPEIIPGEKYKVKQSFIEKYHKWGKERTDACPAYHDLCAFMLLSSLLAGNLKLETSYGTMRPNLWGLILGDTTLTRKTTAMQMATSFINDIDNDIILATDGSVEGLLGGLQGRPSKTSMFFRDEVTGFFNEMQKKDYLTGMPQMFTQLYDCPPIMRRRLKKELISITNPIFIFFGGGIRDHMYTTMDENYIISGFLPRFLVVAGETDLTQVRRTGPPTQESIAQRQEIYKILYKLYSDYTLVHETTILGKEALMPTDVEAILTEDAWELIGEIEFRLVEAGANSANPTTALPTFERLSRSMLKMAVLLAATKRQPVEGFLQVNTDDVIHAARYAQEWGNFTVDLLQNVGQTVASRTYNRALQIITENPGILRGAVMRHMNLSKHEMTDIQDTLEARGQIEVFKEGKSVRYNPF